MFLKWSNKVGRVSSGADTKPMFMVLLCTDYRWTNLGPTAMSLSSSRGTLTALDSVEESLSHTSVDLLFYESY